MSLLKIGFVGIERGKPGVLVFNRRRYNLDKSKRRKKRKGIERKERGERNRKDGENQL